MKKIKFLILFIALTSCNKYLGTVDPDYTPTNEVTEIFSNVQNDTNTSEVKFGDIIFPDFINPSLSINNLKIDKIINTDKNSVATLINDKLFLSKDKNIYVIDINSDSLMDALCSNVAHDFKSANLFLLNKGNMQFDVLNPDQVDKWVDWLE